jgi:hypothetical protein
MKYNFAYKIGHNIELSINEYLFVTKNNNYKVEEGLILSNEDIDINKMGSLIYKAKIIETLSDLPKKIGYVTEIPKEKHSGLLQSLKALGAKKILIVNQEPNYGQVKYVKDWFIKYKDCYLHVVQFFDQELWGRIDMNLPGVDNKKGVINLKLARTMLNLTKLDNIVDPFAGLGRNVIAGWDMDKNFALSDIDILSQKAIEDNIAYIKNKIPSNSTVLYIDTLDALVLTDRFNKPFAVVTEGYATESVNHFLLLKDAQSRMLEVKKMWLNILANWSKIDNLKEIILCLPLFITKEQDIFWDIKQDLPQGYRHQPFVNSDYIFYKRKDTRIGHVIVKLTK